MTSEQTSPLLGVAQTTKMTCTTCYGSGCSGCEDGQITVLAGMAILKNAVELWPDGEAVTYIKHEIGHALTDAIFDAYKQTNG